MGREYRRIMKVEGIEEISGDLVFADDFSESLVSWTPSGTGTDWIVERVKDNAFIGSGSLYLKSRVSGATAGDTIQVLKQIASVESDIVTVSFSFAYSSNPDTRYITYSGLAHLGGNGYEFRIRYDPQNTQWEYLNSGGTWSTISGAPDISTDGSDTWHRVELTANIGDDCYGIVFIDEVEIDLSDNALRSYTSAVHYFRSVIKLTAETTNSPEMWVDNVILRAS